MLNAEHIKLDSSQVGWNLLLQGLTFHLGLWLGGWMRIECCLHSPGMLKSWVLCLTEHGWDHTSCWSYYINVYFLEKESCYWKCSCQVRDRSTAGRTRHDSLWSTPFESHAAVGRGVVLAYAGMGLVIPGFVLVFKIQTARPTWEVLILPEPC